MTARLLSYLTLAVTLSFVISPLVTEPFSGFRPDQLPIPQVDPPAQPAGYAFSVWGLIYAWLAVSAVFGALKRTESAEWDAMRRPLIISMAIGTFWLAIANHSVIWATITIFAMAGTAIWAAMRAPGTDRWWAFAPVAIYAGWLTAASFVSLAAAGAGYGVITGAIGWAYLAILGATLIAALVLMRLGHVAEYASVLAWALIGIIVANGAETAGISIAAVLAIVVLGALAWARHRALRAD